ncbi:MAG: carbohydrate kinase family protein [Rhodoferax sp.]|nr:carbohydrate kinase family protein [Rhodoferax sp.]
MRKRRIAVVGYLSMDAIEVPDQRHACVPGGAALYGALGARHAGAVPLLVACVGDDYPAHWLRQLAALGIDITQVERRTGPTRRSTQRHGAAGERVSPHFRSSEWWERTQALTPPSTTGLDDVDAVLACPMPVDALEVLLRQARSAGRPVTADTSEAYASSMSSRLLALIDQLAAFAPSREETRCMLPQLDDDTAAVLLAARGSHVLQKRGAAGAFAVPAGAPAGTPMAAPAAQVLDPTGAGDATAGALAAYLCGGAEFLAAARAALKTGALATSAVGPAALGFPIDAP